MKLRTGTGTAMPFLIDRRLNPKDKRLGNRQRFLRRARAQIKAYLDGERPALRRVK